MRNHCVKFHRLYTGLFLLSLLTLIAGCTSAWTSEASSIITILEAAVPSILALLSVFGVGLAPSVMTSVESWGTNALATLATTKTLIDSYNSADATAKSGLLVEIQTGIQTVFNNLSTILPEFKVTDAVTQARIADVIQLVLDEFASLLKLIPVLQGKVTSHDEVKALVAELRTAGEFKKTYNQKVSIFGEQYQLK